MGFQVNQLGMNSIFDEWSKSYQLYAPKLFKGGGSFSDTDCVRYGEVCSIEEVVFDRKSQYSFKEILLPISQTLFFFVEDSIKETDKPGKDAIIFLRSCDIHALKRLDEIYLNNGPEDYYYKRQRDHVKFVMMGCSTSFENCFCTSMDTNKSSDYDLSIDAESGFYLLDNKNSSWNELLKNYADKELDVVPKQTDQNNIQVSVPTDLNERVAASTIWEEYDTRCINCGRCNFACPTCTCFTMQDLFYSENGKAGERRRVWASCMVDGFTDVAGGGSYRQKNGERMRFKVLHKTLDFKQRSGSHMCVGCGRCDDICPEYILFSHCINKLEQAVKEVSES